MNTEHEQSDDPLNDAALDARLRATPPPPADLLARLHGIPVDDLLGESLLGDDLVSEDRLSDDALDARLRETPALTPEMADRLRGIPVDLDVEQMLSGDIERPRGFFQRLHATVDECELERQMAEVPGARDTVVRLHQIPAEAALRRRRAWSWAVGASAAVVAVMVQLASVAGVLQVARPPAGPDDVLLIVDIGPLELTAIPNEGPLVDGPTFDVAVSEEEPEWGPTIEAPWQLAEASPLVDVVQLIDSGVDLAEDIVLAKWGVLGAPNDPEETTPELDELEIEPPRGMEPPRLRGVYDRGFLLREKENPPLSPSAHPALEHSWPPLTKNTHSVDLLRQLAARDRLADEGDLRVEDFVAAERYAIEPTAGEINLSAYAGPSRFSSSRATMLQIAVAVGRLRVDPEPTHWTLAVDVSSGMAWRNRLPEVRRTVAALLREMREEDRLSLIAFREDAWQAVQFATRDQAAEILQAIEGWEPRGRCDFIAGLRQGISTAVDGGFQGQKRLVVVSDGRLTWPDSVSSQVLQLKDRAESLDVQLHWLELARAADASPRMVRQLRSAGAAADQVDGTGLAAARMMEAWYGRSLLAAKNARLHLRFEPKSVGFHRLVGHQASAWGGIEDVEYEINLVRGDQVSVLYELLLKPNGPSRVATATLHWEDPRTGAQRRKQRRITRADFALTFADADEPLQHATLAAEAGEVLSRSFFAVNRSRTLKDVIAASREVKGSLKRDGEFQRFVALLEQVERVRQRRGD